MQILFLINKSFFKKNKMQRQVLINIPSLVITPLEDAAKVKSIDYSAEFDNIYTRMDNF